MKICWDNLEKLRYVKNSGNFYIGNTRYYLKEKCKVCNESFLTQKKDGITCSIKCNANTEKNKKLASNLGKIIGNKSKSTETKKKISNTKKKNKDSVGMNNPMYKKGWKISGNKNGNYGKIGEENHNYGKKKPEHSIKISGDGNPNWKGGYVEKNLTYYDSYSEQLDWCEEVRRNKKDKNILEVRCAYCGKWYIPDLKSIIKRTRAIKGSISGEQRLYCSNECKKECPIFGQKLWPKGFKQATSREVQPELRQMVLKRDNYKCTKCGSEKSLHCHHIEGIRHEPLESADIDKCITVCKKCHKKIHKKDGCGYYEMRCKSLNP